MEVIHTLNRIADLLENNAGCQLGSEMGEGDKYDIIRKFIEEYPATYKLSLNVMRIVNTEGKEIYVLGTSPTQHTLSLRQFRPDLGKIEDVATQLRSIQQMLKYYMDTGKK